MKKIYLGLIVSSVLASSFFPLFNVYASETVSSNTESVETSNDNVNIQNKEALSVYEEAIKGKSQPIQRRNQIQGTDSMFPESFKDFEFLKTANTENLETLYSEGNNDLYTSVTLDTATNTYSLIEANMSTGDVKIIVNENEYTISTEDENINLYSESGEVLPILITEYDPSNESVYLEQSTNLEDSSNTLSAKAATTFGKEYGPFKKTNKVLIEVLGMISATTGAAAFKIKHPVLGIVSGITGISGYVGDKLYKTFYIKYWQAHAKNDSTYVKQRENYYQYNNYTGFVKSRTIHFHSSRPY